MAISSIPGDEALSEYSLSFKKGKNDGIILDLPYLCRKKRGFPSSVEE